MADGGERWWRMWWPFPWIDPLDGVSSDIVERATTAAREHPPPELPTLPHTESVPRYQALWHHMTYGQITPDKLWRMKRADLGYIAGALHGHPAADIDLVVKLVANATRAEQELDRRNFLWSVLLAAAVAGVVAGVILAVW